jgi:hypothetical protein
MITAFDNYFKSLQSQKISDITEHSYRPALLELIQSLAEDGVKVLHEPKREGKFGSPDFKITRTESIIGYIENKKIEENLDKILKTDQIKKYQTLSDNILLTNYMDWIWLRGGEIQKWETLCHITDIENKKANLDNKRVEAVKQLIKGFLSQAPQEIADAKKLAEALAMRAKFLKDFLLDELTRQQQENTNGRLFQLFETFRSFVFQELTISEFSDTFAQNLVYGLFLAKLNADTETINLYNAKKYISTSFELIKELVHFLDELDNEEYRETRWIVEEVLTILNNLDLRAIHETLSFTKRGRNLDTSLKDPYLYFYEHFLTAYDKKLRKAKGVYYTPPPVVNFIIRAIDDILIDTFKIQSGLADKDKVTILDFATGTGTFLVEILQQIFEKLPKDSGKKNLIIQEHILKNLCGFEYLIAPYTIAHLKLSQFLKDNGYELKPKERLPVYLTNTLEPVSTQTKIPFLPALTEESKQAQQIKDKPLLVITGNPPYSYVSHNNGEWITNKMKNYYRVDGQALGERNPKGLQDDYVKFIRFAQDKMEKVEEGIVGIITNHSFLDNPTYRGMRQSLQKTFNHIYIIDLHGNSDKQELTPQGTKDENVFDIKTGVCISLFVKKKGLDNKVFYTDFWGKRNEKYDRCLTADLSSIEWKEAESLSPFYYLKPQNTSLLETYNKYISVKDIFRISQEGIKTHRDHFVIDTDTENKVNLIRNLKIFINEKYSDAEVAEMLKLKSNRDWDLSETRRKVQKLGIDVLKNNFRPIAYRPFDNRIICAQKELVDWLRETTMQHMMKENLGLISTRFAFKKQLPYSYTFVTNCISDVNFIQSPGSAQLFPLFLYIIEENILKEPAVQYGNREIEDDFEKIENFKYNFRLWIDKYYKFHFSPEEIFGYIYAVLYSSEYRNKYSEFLKADFPRIPFTDDKDIFVKLSTLGTELITAHLLKEVVTRDSFRGVGNDTVEKIEYVTEKGKGKLFINKIQYFDDVPQPVSDFYIGGYKVLEKYLKDRKGHKLSLENIKAVEGMIETILFTINQVEKIDKITSLWI